jgi:SET domain-containing protein
MPTTRKPARKYAVRRSPIHGRGVFAARRIRPGERIIEYTGDRVTNDELDRRLEGHVENGHTMLFTVDDEWTIDATQRGSAARYINHSCEGNCATVHEDGRIFIEAARNIQPGVELTYDYCLDIDGRITNELRRLYQCNCGASRCGGSLLVRARTRTRRASRKK